MIKQYRAIYKNGFGYVMKTKNYKSLAICKRFTKKLDVVRYEEKEITYIFDESGLIPLKKIINIRKID